MPQYDLIFRDSLTCFWRLVFAEWRHSRENEGSPPFHLPESSQSPPAENSIVVIQFKTDDGRREILVVYAEAVPGLDVTKITVFLNDEAYQEIGRPACQRWDDLKRPWEKDGLLVNPLAHHAPPRPRGPHSRTAANIQRLRQIREDARRENRPIPARQFAMHAVGISPKTWRQRAPRLWTCWYDPAIPTPQAEPPELQS